MSREIRRVPLDFDTPIDETWPGYFTPNPHAPDTCPTCEGASYSPAGRRLHDEWWGRDASTFDPIAYGSPPLTPEHPAVRAFAERNCSSDPDYYGTGEAAIVREATRLCALWNLAWRHHLTQPDVDAILASDKGIRDLTHTFDRDQGWRPRTPPVVPTVADVQTFSIVGFQMPGQGAAMAARAEREGLGPLYCETCDGRGHIFPGGDDQEAAYDAWEGPQPPTGPGWQLWQTVSEGGPVTPVFGTSAELVDYLATVGDGGPRWRKPWTRAAAEAMVRQGWAPSGVIVGGEVHQNGEALVAMERDR